ncbi:MAG: 4,5-DOPA dioxygenase extradiol [Candidatus Eremiobacteraeota bacterium]|nr:4,5-DOPA dioxygenase extradiol [Candidatus Eremiobacteraeota bacterium]
MPVLFFGHGNPMNALDDNKYTRAWRSMAETLPRKPAAILAISAHWYVPFTGVTAMLKPRTIHDFGGFPQELHAYQYPAPGDPHLARRVIELLQPLNVIADDGEWGLDHGAWAVLCHAFPNADVPVVQLSIDEREAPRFHYELAKRLAPLRDENILVIGSGNVVHNLHAYGWGRHVPVPYDWATKFEKEVRLFLEARNHRPLIEYEELGEHAVLSAPTPDHYLPLLYVAALQGDADAVQFPVEGVDGGSVSMLSVRIG